jgi:hypothetical protein
MFRQWLEKSPCHKVGDTIDKLMNPPKPETDPPNPAKDEENYLQYLKEVAAMVNYRRTGGEVSALKQHNRPGGDPAGKIKQKPPGQEEIDQALW